MRDGGGADRPDFAAVASMARELKSALGKMDDLQREALRVTGVAWSDDRLIKAVVGPRGHLLELEIDPRVYRTPNSKALAATILGTVRAATEDAMAKTQQILERSVPADLRSRSTNRLDLWRLSRTHDADLRDDALHEEGSDGLR